MPSLAGDDLLHKAPWVVSTADVTNQFTMQQTQGGSTTSLVTKTASSSSSAVSSNSQLAGSTGGGNLAGSESMTRYISEGFVLAGALALRSKPNAKSWSQYKLVGQ